MTATSQPEVWMRSGRRDSSLLQRVAPALLQTVEEVMRVVIPLSTAEELDSALHGEIA